MKTLSKKILAALLLPLMVLLPAGLAAAVTVGAAADKTDVKPGDAVEVTVTVSGKGITVAHGFFTYDPAVLTYTGSEGGASDGFLELISAEKGGAQTLSARIRFTAAGAGSAKVDVSIDRVLGYDGKEQEGAAASVSVTVAKPSPTPAPTPRDYAAKGVLAQNVQGAADKMYIWRSLENVTVPSRYSAISLDYHGEEVAAAKVEDTDAPTLLYLSDATGNEGGYYIFDAAKDVLYPYQTISSVSKSYILLAPDEGVKLPEGFSETMLTIGEKQYSAWKSQDAPEEVYLVYARNPDGDTGYYIYNAGDESLQRYAVLPAPPVLETSQAQGEQAVNEQPSTPGLQASPAPGKEGEITLSSALFYAICCVGGLLVIALIWLLSARSAKKTRPRQPREHDLGQ